MSSTSLRIQSKDTIYQTLIKEFLKEGKDFLLKRNFELGEGWDFKNVVFLYNYLPLLCIMSCNTEYYFNEKIKEMLSIECNTKYNVNLEFDNEQNLTHGTKMLLEHLLCSLQTPCQENKIVEWAQKEW